VRYLRHRTVAFLAGVILAGAAWELYIWMAAPGRLDPDLARAMGREPFVNVAVTLGFAPEDFHIRLFQTYGVVSGVQGMTVKLQRVPADGVMRLARLYWVRRISREP